MTDEKGKEVSAEPGNEGQTTHVPDNLPGKLDIPVVLDPKGGPLAKLDITSLNLDFGGGGGDSNRPFDKVVPGATVDGCEVDQVVERAEKYVVYITKNLSVEVAAAKDLEKAIDQSLYRRWGYLNSAPIANLEATHRTSFLKMLAHAVASIMALDKDASALAIERAEKYYYARTAETAKRWFFESSTVMFGVLLLVCLIVLATQGSQANAPKNETTQTNGKQASGNLADSTGTSETNSTTKGRPESGMGEDSKGSSEANTNTSGKKTSGSAEDSTGSSTAKSTPPQTGAITAPDEGRSLGDIPFVRIMAFGLIGAYLSVLQRLASFPSDSAAGKVIHYIDGSSRVFLGMLFAILGALGFYANVFFGFIQPNTTTFAIVVCLVATISGASERLIPSLITSFSDRATSPPSPG